MLSPALLLFEAACYDSAPPPGACLDVGIEASCTPAYEPTYDAVFRSTLQPSCAKSGVSCHASTGRQGGLDFDDPEAAYAALTARHVRPGRPECSPLVHRIASTDGNFRMPPGRSLEIGAQCAIHRWVAAGARR